MLDEVSMMNPTIGIASVARYETDMASLPDKADATVVGAKMQNNLHILFEARSVDELARELTTPRFTDGSIFVPNRFDAAMYDTAEKIQSEGDSPAAEEMQRLKATRMQWRENTLALSMA